MREFPGSTWPWMQILKRRGSALHWGDSWDHLPAHRGGGGGGQWRGVRVPVCDDNLYLRGLTVTLVARVLHHNWLLGAESGLPQTGSTSSVKTRLVEHVDQTSQPVTITLSNTIITALHRSTHIALTLSSWHQLRVPKSKFLNLLHFIILSENRSVHWRAPKRTRQ